MTSNKKTSRGSAGKEPSSQETNMLVALFKQGRYTELETLARAMTARFPLHGFGWKAMGTALLQQGRNEEALASLQKAVKLSQGDAQLHNNLGNTLTKLGRLTEAEASYRQALKFNPGFAEAHYNLGSTLQKLDRLSEAETSYRRALELKPDFVEAHNSLGNTLLILDRLSEAETSYRRTLELKPDYAEAHRNLGDALNGQDRFSEAEASYRRALELKPDYAETHSNLGIALNMQDRLSEAEASYRHALKLKPDYAEALNNLGFLLRAQNRLSEAEASYRRALELKPDYAETHSNLGVTLNMQGRLSEAEASYRRAIELNPDYADALNNLALLFNVQGEPTKALNLIKTSLKIEEKLETKKIFVECVKRLRFMHDNKDVRHTLVRALSEPWGHLGELVRSSADLVKLNPGVGGCIARATKAWPRRLSAQDLFGAASFAAVATDPLLRALLDSTPICDIEMERFLTMVRRTMLNAATIATVSEVVEESVLAFYSALARQCFINEYVFAWTDEEVGQAQILRDSLAAALEAKTPFSFLWPVTVGAYFPLYPLPFAARLMDRPWPDAVTAVLTQQIREPEEEQQYRTTMPRLTTIEGEVSLLVQNQYEENPYPRWVKAVPVGKPVTIDKYLRQRFPFTPFKPLCKSSGLDILIAGCGTGQHSINTAQTFHGARVLAVDLSLTSLCYAKRKTQELGLPMIEYAQADILKLGSLGRSFDVIESVGVLHHLDDPMAGWRVLLSLLRPGGFMRLGFYSEVARRNLVRIRSLIAEQGCDSAAEDIRSFRQNLMDSDNSAGFEKIMESVDFFSVSACRDLLFHVQEHRMTLTGIEMFLRSNDLAFLGFLMEADVIRAYKRRFPEDLTATNLGQWQIFENENPDTFTRMYQFWVQKAG